MADLRIGPPIGAGGVVVYQKDRDNVSSKSTFGTAAIYGVLKRGPMGVATPVYGLQDYHEKFGDPSDRTWHLYGKSEHLTPDWIDGFFANGGSSGTLLVTRLELDGKGKKSEVIINGRNGRPVLKLKAANEGRWAGGGLSIENTSVVAATSRTFTIVAPGLLAGQLIDGYAKFSGVSKNIPILSNTGADLVTGEAVITVDPEYDLLIEGVSGPTELAGTATYQARPAISGIVTYDQKKPLTGTVDITGKVVVGTGTSFLEELAVGMTLYRGNEGRTIESIASNTTLTLSEGFSSNGIEIQLNYANLTVVGVGTLFESQFAVGDKIYVTISGQKQGRTVASIVDDSILKLSSGFTASVDDVTAYLDSKTITGTGSDYDTQVQVGDYIVDPYRSGSAAKVVSIPDGSTLVLDSVLSGDFEDIPIYKQSQVASVGYEHKNLEDGISVLIGTGVRKPESHFSLSCYFNGVQVIQIDDASLERSDVDFIESKLLSANAAHQDESRVYAKYIEAEVLLSGAYVTAKGNDVRPSSGNGVVLKVSGNKLYTLADVRYSDIPGTLFYPNTYDRPSGYMRAIGSSAPVKLEGTITGVDNQITGVSTTFLDDFVPGDFFRIDGVGNIYQVVQVDSDTAMTVDGNFPDQITTGVGFTKLGWISVASSADLVDIVSPGDEFLLQLRSYLQGGYDGDTVSLRDSYWSKYADNDLNHLESAARALNLGMIRVCCPGVNSLDIQRAFADYCVRRAYEFRVEIPSHMSDIEAINFVRKGIGLNDGISVAYPSYGYAANPDGSGSDRLCPVTGDIVGGETAVSVNAAGYHRSFLGVDARISPRIRRMVGPVSFQQEARLNSAGIQQVKTVDGKIVVFGNRAPAENEEYTFIHASRIQKNLIRFFTESSAILERMYKPNSEETIGQLIFLLEDYAAREYQKEVFSAFLNFSQNVLVYDLNIAQSSLEQSPRASLIASENGKISIVFRYIPSGMVEVIELFVSPDKVVSRFGSAVNTAF